MNGRGHSRGRPRGRSRGRFRGPTRGVKFRGSRALCLSEPHQKINFKKNQPQRGAEENGVFHFSAWKDPGTGISWEFQESREEGIREGVALVANCRCFVSCIRGRVSKIVANPLRI